ncbi:substrate-binding domain-containing protein [Janibacter sp. GXQ6167]|uniref:substrate-binding domain-containing protein n=1 Tax=Janibacter sp. GXQ6167 TaxID=3240791 RepID=UPI003525C3F1
MTTSEESVRRRDLHGPQTRRSRRGRRSRAGLAWWLVPIIAVVGLTGWWFGRDQPEESASGCGQTTEVVISASPDMAAALPDVIGLTETPKCSKYVIEPAPSAVVAATLTQGDGKAPAAWIPDSDVWVDWVRARQGKVPEETTAIASTPLVIAAPKGANLPQDRSWLNLTSSSDYRIADPRTSTESLLSMLVATVAYATDPGAAARQQTVTLGLARQVTSDTELAAASTKADAAGPSFPSTEQQVASINNQTEGGGALQAVVPSEGTTALTYSWVPLARQGLQAKAVAAFQKALTSPEGATVLRNAGFRTPGTNSVVLEEVGPRPQIVATPTLAQLNSLHKTWAKVSKPLRINAVMDISGSMKETDGPRGSTRISAAVSAAKDGLALIEPGSAVGLWAFSTGLDGSTDYLQLAPVKKLGKSASTGHRGELNSLLDGLPERVRGDTGLYDTVKAAYGKAQATFDPKARNVVMVLTDGRNDDSTGGISLAQLRSDLATMQDPKKPITVLLVGIGDGTSEKELKSIVGALKPTKEQSNLAITERDPAKLRAVFVQALLHGTR